jgi:hypothetical protein
MEVYSVYLHFDLLEVVPGRGEKRRRIMAFVRSLSENPNTPGDYTDKDASLRTRQIKVIGSYAITYWVDDPAKAVMVVGVRPADRWNYDPFSFNERNWWVTRVKSTDGGLEDASVRTLVAHHFVNARAEAAHGERTPALSQRG